MDKSSGKPDRRLMIKLINGAVIVAKKLKKRHVSISFAEAHDIIRVLEAQEPRLMTLEEVASLEEHQFIWLEINNSEEPIYCFEIVQICGSVSDSMEIALNFWYKIIFVYTRKYNQEFRFWSNRPTEKQREAEPWSK